MQILAWSRRASKKRHATTHVDIMPGALDSPTTRRLALTQQLMCDIVDLAGSDDSTIDYSAPREWFASREEHDLRETIGAEQIGSCGLLYLPPMDDRARDREGHMTQKGD